uniref:Uroplakin 3B n=1 Tax=Cyanoderma ruficeps TaxID=181631 RepID=A0A8C3NT03_9PASS
MTTPRANAGVGAGWGRAPAERCRTGGSPHSLPTPPAQLPYVPQVPPMALLGKVTATTFALERPCCVFDGHADASDAVWLAVAFANGEDSLLRHVPALATARSYMTLETAAAAYSCSAPGSPVLRVGSDTACRDQGRQDPCNGPLPSPGPYRVKFLLMGCGGPKAETRWSEPILLRRGTCGTATPPRVPCTCLLGVLARHQPCASTPKPAGRSDPRSPHPSHLPWSLRVPSHPSSLLLPAVSPSTIDPAPARRGSAVVIITSILASLAAVLATTVLGALGYGGLLGGQSPWGPQENTPTPSAKKWRSF